MEYLASEIGRSAESVDEMLLSSMLLSGMFLSGVFLSSSGSASEWLPQFDVQPDNTTSAGGESVANGIGRDRRVHRNS